MRIYSSAHPSDSTGWSTGTCASQKLVLWVGKLCYGIVTLCLWQDGITHADLSINGTIWAHSFIVTCKLHRLDILCIFETTQMNCYRKEALKLFQWQSHSHGVTLPFSKKTSLVTWVKYALAKSHSTKLPTGYSHTETHILLLFLSLSEFRKCE